MVRNTCCMIDPKGDGSIVHATQEAKRALDGVSTKLNVAFERWEARLEEITFEDLEANGQLKSDYDKRWHDGKKDMLTLQELKILTSKNAFPPAKVAAVSNIEAENSQAKQDIFYKPVMALKPAELKDVSNLSDFRDWCKRFTAFFLSSNLRAAPVCVQQDYFEQCLNPDLSSRLELTEDLPVFGETENDPSCMALLNKTKGTLVHNAA